MQSLFFFLLAALAGLFQPIQSGINSQLKYDLNSTYLSGAISNFIGALLMVGLALTLERNGLQSPTLSGNHLGRLLQTGPIGGGRVRNQGQRDQQLVE